MPMRVVADDATLEPEHVCYPKIVAKDVFVILLCEARIPFLDFAQKAFFGGEQRAAAVHINASAFENYSAASMLRLPEAAFQFLVCFGNDQVVFLVIWILGPAVELKIIESDFTGFGSNTDRAGVPHPAAIGGRDEKIHGIEIRSRFFEDRAHARLRFAIFNQQENALDARKMADDFGESPGNSGKFSRPIACFVGPAEPGRLVWFPFRGHAEAERERRCRL